MIPRFELSTRQTPKSANAPEPDPSDSSHESEASTAKTPGPGHNQSGGGGGGKQPWNALNSTLSDLANRKRVEKALTEAYAGDDQRAIDAAKLKASDKDARGRTKQENPPKYSGCKNPQDLVEWSTSVTMWFLLERIHPDSLEATNYIQGFLKDKAFAWYMDNVGNDLLAYIALFEEANKNKMPDRSCESPWPFHDILAGLREHFISLTFTRDAAYKFSATKQSIPGKPRLSASELGDRLREISKQMRQCSDFQLKERYMNALDLQIAAETNKLVDFDEEETSFKQ
jgi:hypothetical protein